MEKTMLLRKNRLRRCLLFRQTPPDLSGGRLEDFFLGLQQNNPDYRSVWDTYLKHLAVVINNLHMILDYDIVLGGYVGSSSPLARLRSAGWLPNTIPSKTMEVS